MWRYKLCHTLLKIAAHAKSIFMYRNSWFLSWLGGLFNHAVLSLYIHKRSASPIVLLLYLNFIFYMKCSGEIRFLNEQVAQLSRGVEANKKNNSLLSLACMLRSTVKESNAAISPSAHGNGNVWVCTRRGSDITEHPQNPKKNKASCSQSQIIYFHMLFRQPFPAVIISPNSFKCLFNGEPSPPPPPQPTEQAAPPLQAL